MSTDLIPYETILETKDMIAVMNHGQYDHTDTLMIFFTDGTYFSSGYGKDTKCLWKMDENGHAWYRHPELKPLEDWKKWSDDEGETDYAIQLSTIISTWMMERAVFYADVITK